MKIKEVITSGGGLTGKEQKGNTWGARNVPDLHLGVLTRTLSISLCL